MGDERFKFLRRRNLSGETQALGVDRAPIEFLQPRNLRDVSRAQFLEQAPSLIRARSTFVDLHQAIDPALLHLQPPPVEADVFPFGPPDVPHLAEQNGNVFAVPDDPSQMWYLPTFVLLDDPDTSFGFAASQAAEIDQETGDPFNKCRVTMSVRKAMPDDAAAFLAANPTVTMREIPLEDVEGAIVIRSVVQGTPQSTPCVAIVTPNGDGTFLVTADGILGVRVISLFQNLLIGGNAQCIISASYRVWRIKPRPPLPPGTMSTMMLRFEVAPVPMTTTLEIGRKFESDPYRLKFTIATTGEPRVIINADDLRSFNVHQSEYVELRALGDVSARYPSINKLYLGVLSKTIVVIPARYVILRDAIVCAARCSALVDSSPGLSAGCKFQFGFTFAPDVSSIDLVLLLNEINAHPEAELHGLSLHLPRSFTFGADGAVDTSFLTSSRFEDGVTDPHNIDLSCEIKEQAGGTPAIANANLFLAQLRTTQPPFLSGSIGIRLDDAFRDPIRVPVLINFSNTQSNGPAGLTLRVDETNKKAILENGSPFDLSISRAALLTSQGVVVALVGQVIPAAGSLSLDLPEDHTGLTLLSDCELALGPVLSKEALFKLLQLQTVDVQNTQFLLSINATAVSFGARAIDQIEITIALTAAPDTAIARLVVRKERLFDSTRILLPFEQALVELDATLSLKVTFLDPARSPVQLSLQNDFGQHPIFQIADADLNF